MLNILGPNIAFIKITSNEILILFNWLYIETTFNKMQRCQNTGITLEMKMTKYFSPILKKKFRVNIYQDIDNRNNIEPKNIENCFVTMKVLEKIIRTRKGLE